MIDCTTEALVLGKEPVGELDAWIHLYTREFGKVRARAKSIRKITSKLGGHLEPGLLATVRLIRKSSNIGLVNSFQITDALAFKKAYQDFKFLNLIRNITHDMVADNDLWNFLQKGAADYEAALQISGFGLPEMVEYL